MAEENNKPSLLEKLNTKLLGQKFWTVLSLTAATVGGINMQAAKPKAPVLNQNETVVQQAPEQPSQGVPDWLKMALPVSLEGIALTTASMALSKARDKGREQGFAKAAEANTNKKGGHGIS